MLVQPPPGGVRVRARLPERPLRVPELKAGGEAAAAVKGDRRENAPEAGGYVDHTVVDRYRLPPGAELTGPLIVEERESTVVIGPYARMRVDEHGFLWIDLPATGGA